MIIRAAIPADLPRVQSIHLNSWRDAYAEILPESFLGQPLAEEMARKWSTMPEGEVLFLVAESDDVHGFALVRCDHSDGPLLDNLHVSMASRGMGVGLRLMKEVALGLRNRGFDDLWLEVLEDNSAARRFYSRLGGREGVVFMDNLVGNAVPARKVRWQGLEKILFAGEKS